MEPRKVCLQEWAEMAEDSAGNLWIGGRVTVARLDRRGLISYREPDGLASKNIMSIEAAADGSMYVVNGDFAISRFDGARFQTTRAAVDTDASALDLARGFSSSAGNGGSPPLQALPVRARKPDSSSSDLRHAQWIFGQRHVPDVRRFTRRPLGNLQPSKAEDLVFIV
jgi:hypothetical protein